MYTGVHADVCKKKYNSISSATVMGFFPVFKVVEVDLNIFSNKFRHNTMDYKGKRNLIVRRGQTFTMKVTLDQPFDKDNDVIRLQLAMGE